LNDLRFEAHKFKRSIRNSQVFGILNKMRAIIYMFLGFLFISLGAYNLYSGYELENPYVAGFGFAAIIIGAMMALYGISQSRKKPKEMKNINSFKNEPVEREQDGAIEIHAIIQSMGVVAVADKRIRNEEVETIASIYQEMLGMKIRDEEVLEILSEFDDHFDIEQRLERNRSYISPTMKRTIIESCQKVMVSDLEIVRSEENRIMEIGRALGFSDAEINSIIKSTPA